MESLYLDCSGRVVCFSLLLCFEAESALLTFFIQITRKTCSFTQQGTACWKKKKGGGLDLDFQTTEQH